jgi:hypothetical protein
MPLRIIVNLTLLAALLLRASPAPAGEPLPPERPQGGPSVFEALDKRASAAGGDFSMAAVSRAELSAILWAASGLNRQGKGWTVPMWRGTPPYCRVYVAADNGVFLYDWKNHSLETVSGENIKGTIGKQSFVKKAFFSLIFVSDGEALARFNNDELSEQFSHVAVGAMTQNVYLACAALRLNTRYIHAISKDEIVRALKLPPADIPIAVMLLGK